MDKRNKTGGREAWTPNKITKSIREKIDSFLALYIQEFEKDFHSLEPKEKLYFLIKLLEYTTPKLKSIHMNVEETRPTIQVIVRDEETKRLIEQLRE